MSIMRKCIRLLTLSTIVASLAGCGGGGVKEGMPDNIPLKADQPPNPTGITVKDFNKAMSGKRMEGVPPPPKN